MSFKSIAYAWQAINPAGRPGNVCRLYPWSNQQGEPAERRDFDSMTIQEKLAAFAELVTAQQKSQHEKTYTHPFTGHAKVVPGKKYAKVDVGTSGRFMVEMDSGNIFGIKAYGVIHRGHPYGNLDTIQDWYWGDYYPIRQTRTEAA